MTYTFHQNVDLRMVLTEARDQGDRGTCVAFAVTSCHEHHRSTDTDLSEEFLYWCCKTIDQDDDEGTHFDSAFLALQTWGQAQRGLLPYSPIKVSPLPRSLEQHVLDDASLRLVTNPVIFPSYISSIEKLLDEERTIAVGVHIHDNFYTPNEGYIDLPEVETFKGGHAILIVGYGIRNDQKKYFIIRNSWGKTWGDQGYAYLSYEYLEKYLIGNAWYIDRRTA